MGKGKIIDYVGSESILKALNDILRCIGFEGYIQPDFQLSENDTLFLEKIFNSKAVIDLVKAKRQIRREVGFSHYNYYEANILLMSYFEKVYLFDLLCTKYKSSLIKYELVTSFPFCDENLRILIDIHLLMRCHRGWCMFDDWLNNDDCEYSYKCTLDYNNLHITAKQFVFKTILMKNHKTIVDYNIIHNLEFSNENFERLIGIYNYYFGDFEEYVTEKEEDWKSMMRPAPDYETEIMSALINGYGDTIGY